jgi:DNA-binding response OmpR family regulator
MSDNPKPLILVVEDDKKLSMINCRALESEGYEIKAAFTLREAHFIIGDADPDVILLDIKMPDGNGFDFCREIRHKSAAHIIFLTSVKEAQGELEGLSAGGDDYLRKPYGIDLLRERVKIALHKSRKLPQIIKRGPFSLNIIASQALVNGEDLLLSQKEFSALLLLAENERKILTNDYIYEKIWGQAMTGDNPVKMVISRLRTKIEPYGYTIATYRGQGHAFEKI